MNKTTKAILAVLGLAAIIVPAVLLILFSARGQKEPKVQPENRQIDPTAVKMAVDKYPKPTLPAASPASPSAKPSSASSSAK